jgi:DNA repair exonuclease SbcCD ATPase subunit
MILFKQIKFRNFLSTGHQPTIIKFTETDTTLIVGANGAGKSTMLDALCFCLFNKAFRKITKGQLINSVNGKECLVEIEFSVGTKEYKVVRGIKPNIFEIWIDGVLQNQSAASIDQQKQLEDLILKLNYKSFTQIVILGSASFVPFMQLSTANRREVVEDLLDIKIFSAMNLVIKEKIRQNKDEIKTLELKKESLFDKMDMQKNFIEELENRGKQNIQKKKESISLLDKEIEMYMRESSVLEEIIFEKQKEIEEYSNATDKLKKLGNLKGKISEKISSISKDHKFFSKNLVCPTCTQKIDESFRLNKIIDAENKAKELQSGYKELEQTIQEEEERENKFLLLSKEIVKVTNEITQNNTRITSNQRQVQSFESEIQTIIEQLENKNIEHQKLDEFKKNLETTYNEIVEKKKSFSYYDFTYSLLKDGGVKTKIIKKYLPLMNHLINKYLQMMDFYINFNLDEEFKESIKTPIHEDFSYDSFSEGEKMRINLAILFTWREIARMKNSVNTNLLILDEVFDSSLDCMGTDYFSKIIRFVIKNTNVFVISHKTDELIDKFDRIIKFDKIKGFSKMIDG